MEFIVKTDPKIYGKYLVQGPNISLMLIRAAEKGAVRSAKKFVTILQKTGRRLRCEYI